MDALTQAKSKEHTGALRSLFKRFTQEQRTSFACACLARLPVREFASTPAVFHMNSVIATAVRSPPQPIHKDSIFAS